jgi:hypothetical protein
MALLDYIHTAKRKKIDFKNSYLTSVGVTVHHDQVHTLRRLGHRHGHHHQAPATHNERRRGKRPGRNDEAMRHTTIAAANNYRSTMDTPPCTAASFEVNREPRAPPEHRTGESPSVRLCVGPELSRCVHFAYFFKTALIFIACASHLRNVRNAASRND